MTRRDPPGSDYYDFTYDAEDHLVQAKKNSVVVGDYSYDGDGARVMSVMGGVTTKFVGSHWEWTSSSVKKYYLGLTQNYPYMPFRVLGKHHIWRFFAHFA